MFGFGLIKGTILGLIIGFFLKSIFTNNNEKSKKHESQKLKNNNKNFI